MVFYPAIRELFNPGLQEVTGLLIHLVVLFASIMLSFYGLRNFARYTVTLSKNTHLLGIAFALITFIPIGDMFEHLELFPGTSFWHHMHIFTNVAAFYFIYRFVQLIDAKEREDMGKSAALLVAITVFGIVFSESEEMFKAGLFGTLPYHYVIGTTYIALFIAIFWISWKFLDQISNLGKMESAFSLKSFAISMIPIISACLLATGATSLTAEFIRDIIPSIKSHPFVLLMVASVNVFYLSLAMTLVGFGYMAEKIHGFYAPIEKFVARKKTETRYFKK